MRDFILTLLLFYIPTKAFAFEAYSGVIVNVEPQLQIELSDKRIMNLTTSNPAIFDDILRLNLGDVLHFQGTTRKDCVFVTLFENIQIYSLQGTWQSHLWHFFKFSFPNELTIDRPSIGSSAAPTIYSYTIYPGSNDSWSIILTNEEETRVGTIRVNFNQAELKIYPKVPEYGEEVFHLHRIQ
ncbi:MAG: hypothetical protein KDD58_09555 [Bdellovibrionales bacterium]|nr:hypothetical protein [Bdellovibrionales bacterium]